MDNNILKAGCIELGLKLTDFQLAQFDTIQNELIKWNKTINLTSITCKKEIVIKHFLDSLSIHKYINKQKIADIGTGAGFPSLPLAIIYPHQDFYLIEKNNKKIIYLQHIRHLLKLKNIHILHDRAENITGYNFDIVLCRAYDSLVEFYKLSTVKTYQKSIFLAMKATNFKRDYAKLLKKCNNTQVFNLIVPFMESPRFLIQFSDQQTNE